MPKQPKDENDRQGFTDLAKRLAEVGDDAEAKVVALEEVAAPDASEAPPKEEPDTSPTENG